MPPIRKHVRFMIPPKEQERQDTKPIYVGVDPGASGGLAFISGHKVEAVPMPDTERDVWDWFEAVAGASVLASGIFAAIEQVSGYIGEAQPGSAAFKFGQSYGMLRMALIAAAIPFEAVVPQRWQKGLGIPPRKKGQVPKESSLRKNDLAKPIAKETKTSYKNRLKAAAQRIFPSQKVTLATADALLIAEYCKRSREGRIT